MTHVAQESLKGRGKHTFETSTGLSITIKIPKPQKKKKKVNTAEEVQETEDEEVQDTEDEDRGSEEVDPWTDMEEVLTAVGANPTGGEDTAEVSAASAPAPTDEDLGGPGHASEDSDREWFSPREVGTDIRTTDDEDVESSEVRIYSPHGDASD